MERDNRYFIEALHRGLRILEAFTEDRPELTLNEIAKAVQLDKSTAFRFVYTLEFLGYLERDPESKRYRPGLKVLRLGFATINSLDLTRISAPHLKALFAEINEAVNVAVRDNAEVVYVMRHSPAQTVIINLQLGARLPVHCTSVGKVQLIDMSEAELRSLLGEGPYPAFTEHTITRLDALRQELVRARRLGYAISDEELTVGVRSVAAPIRNAQGQIIAGVNVSVSSLRFSRQKLETELAARVVATAAKISVAMGVS